MKGFLEANNISALRGCNSEEAKKKASETRKNNPKRKEQEKKAAQTRAAWYKNPENYEKFKEAIRKRDKKKNQSSGNNF